MMDKFFLLRLRTLDNLGKTLGTYPFEKCGSHFSSSDFSVLLGCPHWLVKR